MDFGCLPGKLVRLSREKSEMELAGIGENHGETKRCRASKVQQLVGKVACCWDIHYTGALVQVAALEEAGAEN